MCRSRPVILAPVYGGLPYTKETHGANLGPTAMFRGVNEVLLKYQARVEMRRPSTGLVSSTARWSTNNPGLANSDSGP